MSKHKGSKIAFVCVLVVFFLIAIVALKDYADSNYFSAFYIPVMNRTALQCTFFSDGHCYVPFTLSFRGMR